MGRYHLSCKRSLKRPRGTGGEKPGLKAEQTFPIQSVCMEGKLQSSRARLRGTINEALWRESFNGLHLPGNDALKALFVVPGIIAKVFLMKRAKPVAALGCGASCCERSSFDTLAGGKCVTIVGGRIARPGEQEWFCHHDECN